MERLTFDGNFCDIAMCQEVRDGSFCEDGYCYQRKVWERLKAYEDTELMPKEVVAKLKWADHAAKALTNIFGNVGVFDLSKLNDLMKSDQQRWIPVMERLPEEGKEVLALCWYHESWQPHVCYLSANLKGRWITSIAGQWMTDVSHWMPLPEPPEEVTQ